MQNVRIETNNPVNIDNTIDTIDTETCAHDSPQEEQDQDSDGSEFLQEIFIGPETPIFSGFLMKKGKFKWKRRWIILQSNRLLYYKDEKEYELLGIIEFKDVVSLSKVVRRRDFVFALVTKTKTFYLQAPDDSHFKHWMESLRNCLNLEISSLESSDSDLELSSPVQEQLENSIESVVKSGYLKKQSNSLGKPFKKRWFVLRKNLLTIYKNSTEYVAQTVLDLKLAVGILEIDPLSKTHQYCFKIIDSTGLEIIVSCENSLERSDWIKSLLLEKNGGKI